MAQKLISCFNALMPGSHKTVPGRVLLLSIILGTSSTLFASPITVTFDLAITERTAFTLPNFSPASAPYEGSHSTLTLVIDSEKNLSYSEDVDSPELHQHTDTYDILSLSSPLYFPQAASCWNCGWSFSHVYLITSYERRSLYSLGVGRAIYIDARSNYTDYQTGQTSANAVQLDYFIPDLTIPVGSLAEALNALQNVPLPIRVITSDDHLYASYITAAAATIRVPEPVPEPGTWTLLLSGFGVAGITKGVRTTIARRWHRLL